MNDQLYPRDINSNKARVVFTFNVTANVEDVRIIVTRDGLPFETIEIGDAPLTYNDEYFIEAGLHNYGFRLAYGTNSAWLDRTKIVAGDVYLIQGQSNAEARKMKVSENGYPGDLSDPDCHGDAGSAAQSFVRVYGGGADNYTKEWDPGDGNKDAFTSFNTGQVGMRIASEIVKAKSIPVCIINGAERGFHLDQFLRSTSNPNDPSTNYGRTLNRLIEAGLQQSIRAVIWCQGEANSVNPRKMTTTEYLAKFNELYTSWEQDFPGIEKYYIVQIRPGCDGGNSSPESILPIQEAHREFVAAQPNRREIISTNGLPKYYDNCHYFYSDGYKIIGDRLLALMLHDLYNEPISTFQYSPKPNQTTPASWSGTDVNGIRNKVSINLDRKGYNLGIAPGTGNLTQRFKLTGTGTYNITNLNITSTGTGSQIENKIEISFTRGNGTVDDPATIAYMNQTNSDNLPAIANNSGLGIQMISFSVPISEFVSTPVDPLALRVSSNANSNSLLWEVEGNQDFELFEIERGESSSKLKSINEVSANGVSGKGHYQFVDHKPNSVKNFYRIKATKTNGNVLYSQVVAVNNNASTRPGISVYPNPAKDQANVSLTVQKAGNATIQIFDGAGAMVSTRKLALLKGTNMFSVGEVLDHKPGIYLIRVVTEEEVFNTRLVRMK